MTPGIRFVDVSKQFRRGRRSDSLRDAAASLAGRLLRREKHRRDDAAFWAVRNLSFNVEPGRVLGFIGPNGAGKSTVLRLLSGLLTPDKGRVEVSGRIGALIELAAGFHPDLTGRENVYLQGAIMGLRRADIRRRFDEIVGFAQVEAFIDTPVKHYSSGMNARLGFSIAAHCEPDVLIVDEVLAVGDRAFQARAYGKLESEVRRGVPVVVVSHQLDRIAALCDRAILLSNGSAVFDGSARECVAAYIDGVHLSAPGEHGPCPIALTGLQLIDDDGRATGKQTHAPGSRLTLRLSGMVSGEIGELPLLGVRLWGLPDESRLGSVYRPAGALDLPSSGAFQIDVALALNLGPGVYRLQGAVWHEPSRTEWAAGEPLLIEVSPQAGSFGGMFLEPEFRTVRR